LKKEQQRQNKTKQKKKWRARQGVKFLCVSYNQLANFWYHVLQRFLFFSLAAALVRRAVLELKRPEYVCLIPNCKVNGRRARFLAFDILSQPQPVGVEFPMLFVLAVLPEHFLKDG